MSILMVSVEFIKLLIFLPIIQLVKEKAKRKNKCDLVQELIDITVYRVV